MSERLQLPGPDGRSIEVLVGGADAGPWLLFHGGSPSAVAEWPRFDDAVRDAGLRLATYSRPGYGASTPRPAHGTYVDDVVESVAVLDHLEVDEFLTAGWSGGGPRALACAALLPDRAAAAPGWDAPARDHPGPGEPQAGDRGRVPGEARRRVLEHTTPIPGWTLSRNCAAPAPGGICEATIRRN